MRSLEDFSALLQNCGLKKNLQGCLGIYAQSVEWGLNAHVFLGGFFIRAFESCDSLLEASKHFLRLPERNAFIWSAIISAHASNGLCEHAIELYKLMVLSGIKPDSHTCVATVKVCAQSLHLMHGMLIHNHIVEIGMELDYHIGNILLDFYGKNCCMHDALKVFGRLKEPDRISWNTVIARYAKEKNQIKVFQLVHSMEAANINPDNVTIANILKACTSGPSLEGGKLVHAWILERGFNVDTFVWSILIDVYAKGEGIQDARKLFDKFSTTDVVAWGTMLAGYVVHEMWEEAFHLFEEMLHLSIRPDNVIFMDVLKVVSETAAFEDGRLVHAYVVERAWDRDGHVVNSLITMYSKCSSILDARALFETCQRKDWGAWSAILAGHFQYGLVEDAFRLVDTMQTMGSMPQISVWNVIIDGCAENNRDNLAFTFFMQMQEQGTAPDSTTCTALLKASWQSLDLHCSRVIHSLITEEGFNENNFVGGTLVSIYSRFGKLEDAHEVFSQLPKRDIIAWNALIEGYADHNLGEEAIVCFQLMQQQSGHKPDQLTVLSMLKACAVISALQEGMSIHSIAIRMNFEADEKIGCSLIDMYTRFGFLDEATTIFESFKKCRSAWNAMIIGSARNGLYKGDAYGSMLSHGIVPNRVTYTCLLSACSHLGLVHEGCSHYTTMTEYWRLKPSLDHYGCMVDLWGRVGCLKEALQVVATLPSEKTYIIWMSLMHHAQIHCRFDLAKKCLDEALHLIGCESNYAYVTMARFLGDTQLHGKFDKVRQFALYTTWSMPGKAFIEVDGRVHTFLVGDKAHDATEDVYSRLKIVSLALRCQGFVPHNSLTMTRMPWEDADDVSLTEFEETILASKANEEWDFSHSLIS